VHHSVMMPETIRGHKAGSNGRASGDTVGMPKTTATANTTRLQQRQDGAAVLGLKIDAAVHRAMADAAMSRALVRCALRAASWPLTPPPPPVVPTKIHPLFF
jgi:hypothetical protein